MAKTPCAKLTKFIKPSVTDKPTLIRYSNMPYAMPSKITVTKAAMAGNLRAPPDTPGRARPQRGQIQHSPTRHHVARCAVYKQSAQYPVFADRSEWGRGGFRT